MQIIILLNKGNDVHDYRSKYNTRKRTDMRFEYKYK